MVAPLSQSAGAWAEDAALAHLRRRGLQLIARNYACKMGEADLIMVDQGVLVIAEVRHRRHHDFGGALESVTRSKQQRLAKAAGHFLVRHPRFAGWPCRFDVISVSKRNSQAHIDWISNAFAAP